MSQLHIPHTKLDALEFELPMSTWEETDYTVAGWTWVGPAWDHTSKAAIQREGIPTQLIPVVHQIAGAIPPGRLGQIAGRGGHYISCHCISRYRGKGK
jgi:hypothetical protein